MSDLSSFILGHPAASSAAISGMVSAIGAFLIRWLRIKASIERTRIRTTADTLAAEAADRVSFRASLMNEVAVLRSMVKDCESDRDSLRERLNTAEGQILILQASNEIMEKWVAFFRDGSAPQAAVPTELSPPEAAG